MEVAAGIRPQISVFGTDYDTRDGTCIRDYVHVEDLASAHVLALEYTARERKDVIVNLGSELGMTVFEMIRIAE
jgi:UDP-glucose 4-epimerase